MTMRIHIENPGLLTTIQDMGRFGYQKYGMPVAGAMDSYALQMANIMVGNYRNEGALEVSFPGFSVVFEGSGQVAITGGDLGVVFNGQEIRTWQSFMVQTGDRLSFSTLKQGCRAYLAIRGGIDVPLVMGSKSTYLRGGIGGYQGRKLLKGDILGTGDSNQAPTINPYFVLPEQYLPNYERSMVRVILGPQENFFCQGELEKFLSSRYQITTQYDRMGYRLEGPSIAHNIGPDIISDGIAPGAIQIPGHGQPIIMLMDRQTVGGYTKIANVISVDLSLLAQLRPGDTMDFQQITIEEAHELYLEQESRIIAVSKLFTK